MADSNTGGMFSKLINPDTARPKVGHSLITDGQKEPENTTPSSPSVNKTKLIEVNRTPLPEKPKDIRRKQISAYLSRDQLQLLKQLYFKLNGGDAEIEKSEIVGLAIEVLSQLLSTKVPRYSSTNKIREYLNTQVSRYLSTQVSDNSST